MHRGPTSALRWNRIENGSTKHSRQPTLAGGPMHTNDSLCQGKATRSINIPGNRPTDARKSSEVATRVPAEHSTQLQRGNDLDQNRPVSPERAAIWNLDSHNLHCLCFPHKARHAKTICSACRYQTPHLRTPQTPC